jgi:hypothetical protein
MTEHLVISKILLSVSKFLLNIRLKIGSFSFTLIIYYLTEEVLIIIPFFIELYSIMNSQNT